MSTLNLQSKSISFWLLDFFWQRTFSWKHWLNGRNLQNITWNHFTISVGTLYFQFSASFALSVSWTLKLNARRVFSGVFLREIEITFPCGFCTSSQNYLRQILAQLFWKASDLITLSRLTLAEKPNVYINSA